MVLDIQATDADFDRLAQVAAVLSGQDVTRVTDEGEAVTKSFVIFKDGEEPEELLALDELQARAGSDGFEVEQAEGQKVLKAMGVENKLDVWVRKAASTDDEVKDGDGFPADSYLVVGHPKKPSTWSLKYKDKNGEFSPQLAGGAWAALTDPNGFRGNKYDGPDKQKALDKLKSAYKAAGVPTPDEKEQGKGAKKGLLLTDKASLRYYVADFVQKGMELGNPDVDEAVGWANEHGMTAHLPESYGGQGLDWDKEPDTAGEGQAVTKQLMYDGDGDGDGVPILDIAMDSTDAWQMACRQLCNNFCDAVEALDQMQDAAGQPGVGIRFSALVAQLAAGLNSIYDNSGEEGDAGEGEGVTKGFTLDPKALEVATALARHEAKWVTKAGQRHNAGDRSLIKNLHDQALDQHDTATKLEPTVCSGSCPMNGDGAGASKGMDTTTKPNLDGAGSGSAEAGVASAEAGDDSSASGNADGDAEALLKGLQAKAMKLEQERDAALSEKDKLAKTLDGMKRSNRPAPQEKEADPLADGQGTKKAMKGSGWGFNALDLLASDENEFRVER